MLISVALLSALLVRFEASDSIHALAHLIDAVDLDSDEHLTSEELRKVICRSHACCSHTRIHAYC